MGKVLIIGAGGVGTVVAHKVAQNPDVFTDIMIASRTKSKCDAIVKAIGNPAIKTAQVDADNVDELVALFNSFKPEIVINVALPYQDLTIMKACLNTRIESLKRGWKGEMLNTTHSTSWYELFDSPCVINLSYVGDDVDKSFFMALILQFLYEYCTAKAELGLVDFNDNGCEHITVIEEAHRVMTKCEDPSLPQYKSAMMFSNMLSEIRAYGEGLLLVDQVPTRLIPDAIKNTNIKITHRLVAEDDCKTVGESMGISKEQRMIIPKLMVGQCIISTPLSTDEHWVKVNKVK